MKVKSQQSNHTARQYGKLQSIIIPTISSTVFHTDHAAIFEVNLEVRITQSKPMQAFDIMSLPSGEIMHYGYLMCTTRYCSQSHRPKRSSYI